ncbi:hypothetical protein EVAR_49472_1 [Eumeta japonica]|uniref:Uncharacterized protein n=1 Tax=Eumeta variegata TaxID=151549 RepID=A0A4C1Y0V9_EUMVA|nr:hypothetical protein EVAR_49472_1 [Eumeta japonica]
MISALVLLNAVLICDTVWKCGARENDRYTRERKQLDVFICSTLVLIVALQEDGVVQKWYNGTAAVVLVQYNGPRPLRARTQWPGGATPAQNRLFFKSLGPAATFCCEARASGSTGRRPRRLSLNRLHAPGQLRPRRFCGCPATTTSR